MTATDELRRMLDERGVEWMPCAWEPQYETFYKNGDGVGFIVMESRVQDGVLLRTDMVSTPEQAIEATLGRGECKDVGWRAVGEFVCSECGHVTDDGIHGTDEFHYCPNCGRKVVGE